MVLVLQVPDDLIVNRIVGRRTDPVTGAIYHLQFSPPPADVADRLVHRKDDTEEAVRTRLGAYHAQTAPIVPHYEKQGLVRRVDGVGDQDEVTERILEALGRWAQPRRVYRPISSALPSTWPSIAFRTSWPVNGPDRPRVPTSSA